MTIRIKDGEFVDEHNRILNLRGVNLSGSSKVPSNYEGLDQCPKSTTFVDRPFPLSDAPLHFRRLRACGFTLVRFVFTWEAIEHAGPGIYDMEYLKYVRQIIEKAGDFGIRVYLDPHQDVWSRWTGGDGAPLWTLELAGFDPSNFWECEAAVCQETYGTGHSSAERQQQEKSSDGDSRLPKMIWPTNYFKLACATMFTLFWAGERFAPQFLVEDDDDDDDDVDDNDDDGKKKKKVNIQTFLQRHYTNAMAELLKHLDGLDNIVGIGTMNEPSAGYINVADLSKGYAQSSTSSSSGAMELRYGLAPTPFQGMCLGEGHVQNVGEWSNGFAQHVLKRPDGTVRVDPKGKKVWRSNGDENEKNDEKWNDGGCIWKQAGVWRINSQTSQPQLLQPDYFANVDFGTECYLPFAKEYAKAMNKVWKSETPLLIFVELPPLEFTATPFPKISSSKGDNNGLPNAVNATHWYDGVTLFTQSWKSYFTFDTRTHRPVFGYNNVFKTHASQLADIKRLGVDRMENAPTLIGEVGIPYDMNGGRSYNNNPTKSGNGGKASSIDSLDAAFGPQHAAMDHTIRCLEKNLLSYTLWCYTPDNTNTLGDRWNGEDLSLYSNEQRVGLDETDPNFIYDGLRAPRAFVRPYARCIAGRPLENGFDAKRGLFRYRGFDDDAASAMKQCNDAPTEIFVPKLWCPTRPDMKVSVLSGRVEIDEEENCFVVKYWHSDPGVEQRVEVRGPGLREPRSGTCRLPSFL